MGTPTHHEPPHGPQPPLARETPNRAPRTASPPVDPHRTRDQHTHRTVRQLVDVRRPLPQELLLELRRHVMHGHRREEQDKQPHIRARSTTDVRPHRSCGLSGSGSVQPRAPNGLGRAGPRRTRPRVATRIVCVVLAREASSLTTWPSGYGQRRRRGPEPSSGGAGAPHTDAVPGVPGRTTTLARSAQTAASPGVDDHTIELIRPRVHSLPSSCRPHAGPAEIACPNLRTHIQSASDPHPRT